MLYNWNLCFLTGLSYLCRSSRCDFELVINKLENIKYFYKPKPKPEFVIYGDIKDDCLAVKTKNNV
jgi:hypothetical protein